MGNEPLGPKPVWGGGAGGVLLPPWAPRAWRLPGPGSRWRDRPLWTVPDSGPWVDKWWRGPQGPRALRLHMVTGPDGALEVLRLQDEDARFFFFCFFLGGGRTWGGHQVQGGAVRPGPVLDAGRRDVEVVRRGLKVVGARQR